MKSESTVGTPSLPGDGALEKFPVGNPDNAPPTRKELACYSLGTASHSIANGLLESLTYPIFNMVLGLNPAWIGMASAGTNLLAAFADPVMGHVGDRTRTPWGRRRPYILAGGALVACTISMMFLVDPKWSSPVIFAWYVGFLLLMLIGNSLFGVSYYALGIEMATDYDQRTRVVAWRSVFAKVIGIAATWYFWFTELFSNPLTGARLLAISAAVLGFLAAVAVVFHVKERKYHAAVAEAPRRESFWTSAGYILGNRTYLRLLLIWTVFSLNMGIFAALGTYLNVYYVFGGNKAAGASLSGAVGTLGLCTSLAAIPLSTWCCRVLGKHVTLTAALWLYIVGSVLKWWCVNPVFPWLQLILPFFFSIGISSVYIVLSSMQADVVDLDELEHGGRREGMFSAVGGWIMKCGSALALGLSGWVLVWTGFDVKLGGAQADGVFFNMRLCFSIIPAIGCLLALLTVRNWPLTRARCEEIQVLLQNKREAAMADEQSKL